MSRGNNFKTSIPTKSVIFTSFKKVLRFSPIRSFGHATLSRSTYREEYIKKQSHFNKSTISFAISIKSNYVARQKSLNLMTDHKE